MKKSDPRPNARELLSAVPLETRLAHTTLLSLRTLVSELQARALFVLTTHNGAEDFENPANRLADVYRFLTHEASTQLAMGESLLAVMENSDKIKGYAAEVEPLLAEVAALEQQEAEARRVRGEAMQALSDATAEAEKRALEAASQDPAVIAAKKALEAS